MESQYFSHFNNQGFDTKIRLEFVDSDAARLHLFIDGDMESFYTKFFMAGINKLLDSEKELRMIYLDFAAVRYVSSSFIANLLQIIHRAKQSDIDVFFLNPNASLLTMIDAMGLAHFVKEVELSACNELRIICKNCRKTVIVSQLGEFECPHCGTTLHVGKQGAVR